VHNIVDLQKESLIFPIWRQAFRPFFLFGSLFGILAMAVWIGYLNGIVSFRPYGNPIYWHMHEMIFGFVSAFIVGFLLTAVQNWTGLRAVNGFMLMVLFLLWLSARIIMALDMDINGIAVTLIDTSFYLFAAILMANLVIRSNNIRNLFFIPVLVFLAACNGLFHLGVLVGNNDYVNQGLYGAIMQISMMIVIIAGRVLPMFTANGTQTEKVLPLLWLERTCVIFSGLFIVLFLFGLNRQLPTIIMALLFSVASICNGIRAIRWRPWITFRTPLVWSLHLAYWFIPLGYGLFALHYFALDVSLSVSIHALTAGAMSALILAMIARVSLGHTGRALKIHHSMTVAFSFILGAALIRITSGLWPALFSNYGSLIAGGCWIIAYSIYLINYSKILTSARPDGRPG
jgi:uncharacterized protein involved in response to NO